MDALTTLRFKPVFVRTHDHQEVLNSAKTVLDKTAGADASVYSNYFRSWAAYFKVSRSVISFVSNDF